MTQEEKLCILIKEAFKHGHIDRVKYYWERKVEHYKEQLKKPVPVIKIYKVLEYNRETRQWVVNTYKKETYYGTRIEIMKI